MFEVKTDRLSVLFVDVEALGVQFVDGKHQQALSDALAAVIGVYKQHFNFARGNAGKARNALGKRILAADQHHRVQVLVFHQVAQ